MKKVAFALLLITPIASYANTGKPLAVGMAYDRGLSAVIDYNQQVKFAAGNEGIALDYTFLKGQFDSSTPLSWYIAGGAYFDWDSDFGARIPLGMNLNFANNWKLYGQIHPEVKLNDGLKLDIGAALGVTYNF
ncbi:hypothetical protein JCM19240_4771 [Vibrio maritimus]|uniref:Outer membrane protein beta-barrel domain-containing protein n=1 Tax=Vibrio maritimus TaxID=990268 RepID=A0A090T7B1_9VIBR|nr:hypothetical protein JCM19240_4771 [Vibrio maritimus]